MLCCRGTIGQTAELPIFNFKCDIAISLNELWDRVAWRGNRMGRDPSDSIWCIFRMEISESRQTINSESKNKVKEKEKETKKNSRK